MFTVVFWKATAERSVKSFAASLASLLGAGAVDVIHTPWTTDLSIAAGAAVVSVLLSIGTGAATDGGPSFGNAEKLPVNPKQPYPVYKGG